MLENLSDGDAARAGERAARPHIEILRIVCVAGRNELDEAAASLLVHLLRLEGYPGIVRALPADALASAEVKVYREALEDTTLVCPSLVSTNSPARAR